MSQKPIVVLNRWRFGQFEFDASTRVLRKHGLRVHIQEQPARVLRALLEQPGEVIAREALKELLWPEDTFVDFERSLNATVAKLRQVLSDSAEQPRYIETEARRGYRFVAAVEALLPALEPEEAPRRNWIWLAAALAVIFIGAMAVYLSNRRPPVERDASVVKFVIAAPEGKRIHSGSAVSDDGRRIAFVTMDQTNQRALWVRSLDSESALRLEHTEGAQAPFFSPGGEDIGFFADGKLKRIPVAGGNPRTICDARQGGGGSWNRDNLILFSQSGKLHRVSAGGGVSNEVARMPAGAGENIVDIWPQFLPDGRRFIVTSSIYKGHANPIRSQVAIGSLDSPQRQLLLENENRARVTPSGQLLFFRRGVLFAQQLDRQYSKLTGEAWPVAENLNATAEGMIVESNAGMPRAIAGAGFTVSSNGVLVYHTYMPPIGQLVWVDRTGKRLEVVGEPQEYTQLFLSPDEKWAVVGIRDGKRRTFNQNIWLMNIQTRVLSRLSHSHAVDADPVWAPDSSRIIFGAQDESKGPQIDLMESQLGGFPRLFYSDGQANKPEAWSPDGSNLLFRRDEQSIYKIPVAGVQKPIALLDTPYTKGRFTFSPDGRWLAFMSAESGRDQVYVCRYPTMTGTRQVSTEGGYSPIWRKDGRELLYMTSDNKVMSVEYRAESSSVFGAPGTLFKATIARNSAHMGQFGVTANGQRLLINEMLPPPLSQGAMHVVLRWDAASRP